MTTQITDQDRAVVRAAAVSTYSVICPCNNQLRRPNDPHSDVCNVLTQGVADARGSGSTPSVDAAEFEKNKADLASALEQLGEARTKLHEKDVSVGVINEVLDKVKHERETLKEQLAAAQADADNARTQLETLHDQISAENEVADGVVSTANATPKA